MLFLVQSTWDKSEKISTFVNLENQGLESLQGAIKECKEGKRFILRFNLDDGSLNEEHPTEEVARDRIAAALVAFCKLDANEATQEAAKFVFKSAD